MKDWTYKCSQCNRGFKTKNQIPESVPTEQIICQQCQQGEKNEQGRN